nr:MAG TPA: Baseplate structural protein [Caudoviricetes sp.]
MPLHGHIVAGFGNDPWLVKAGTGIGNSVTARYHIEIPNCTNVYTEDIDRGYLQANGNGGDQPHNNMPPYLVAYMWLRTA